MSHVDLQTLEAFRRFVRSQCSQIERDCTNGSAAKQWGFRSLPGHMQHLAILHASAGVLMHVVMDDGGQTIHLRRSTQ